MIGQQQTNLSNRSSGVQIPRDICTRFGRCLYSAKCSWIIKWYTQDFDFFGIFDSSDAEMLSSGSDPADDTGLLIYSQSSLKAQYQSAEASFYSKTSPLSSTEWTRFTFMLKKNFDTRLFLDNVNVGSHVDQDEDWPLNSEKTINLASHLSFFGWWSVENIQLSDLSLWRDIPRGGGWETWAGVTLPETLGNALFHC